MVSIYLAQLYNLYVFNWIKLTIDSPKVSYVFSSSAYVYFVHKTLKNIDMC